MILVDCNNLGFASTATAAKKGKPHGAVLDMLGRMRNLVRENPDRKVVALWDGRSWRHDAYPPYKAGRAKDPKMVKLKELWVEDRPALQRGLALLGVQQISAKNMEADDLAARLSAAKVKKGGRVKLISSDRDWLQLVNEQITWIDPIRERTVTHLNFAEHAKIGDLYFNTPWQFIQAKALAGDVGDSIEGVGGLGPAAAQWIFTEYGSVQGLFNEGYLDGKAYVLFPKKFRDFLDSAEKLEAYERNLALVWLHSPHAPPIQGLTSIAQPFNRDAFMDFCEKRNFTTILLREAIWLAPFEQATKEQAA